MKTTINVFGFLRFFLCLSLFSTFLMSFGQTTIDSEDFESGWGIWNDGGGDCFRGTPYVPNNNYGVQIRDNSGSASSTYTNNIDLTPYISADITFDFEGSGMESGEDFWVQFSNDGGTNWNTLQAFVTGTDFNNGTKYTPTITVNSSTYTFTSTSRFRIINDASDNGDRIYLDNIIIRGYSPAGVEIDVKGNNITIADGDTTPYGKDNTDFGSIDYGYTLYRTFTIDNYGLSTLNISSVTLSNTTDFAITTAPATTVAGLGSTTFTITYSTLSLGLKTSTVIINNNDTDEPNYQFTIQANAERNFFDSDGDGIYDNIDIDDDNDGILDTAEESDCENSNISVSVDYKFLNETFGAGNRTTINTTYDAETTYCYEDGTNGTSTGDCPDLHRDDLNDGEYTVYYKAGDGDGTDDTPNAEVAAWADAYWYTGEDHTPNDTNGRMAMFNASYDPGLFYSANITGALPNIPITYSFWVINLDRSDAPGIATRLRPDILVEFRDLNDNLLASITTGDIPPTTAGNTAGDWYNFTADLTFNVPAFNVYFINNEIGGLGNDLAIDDIVISQTLCDTDNDSVADVFDLDADNDGIPDVVEAGFGNLSNGTATLASSWVDTNSNGMHDAVEGMSALDSDGDGRPNYLDLDSDNDAIFDVDESGAGNTGDPQLQNGDGDIDGDGVGDGTDSDAVREKDFDSNGSSEYFTDGILDIYDFFNGSTMATAYGNTNQGNGYTYFVRDTDGDGAPDYMDTDSDNDGIYDIAGTLYASLDANNNGVIDDTNDSEGDGLLDLFDTEDALFGSPRDLDRKLLLYFDGRNDWVEDASATSGLAEATIMGWIKIDNLSPATTQRIFGQNNFYLEILSNKRLHAYGNGYQSIHSVSLTTGQWIHVGATYSDNDKKMRIYVNGLEVKNRDVSGALPTDTSNFTLGRQPNTSSKYFMGYMDEVRVFNKALTEDEFQKMVYQEIEDNTNVRGAIVPRDIETLPWSNVLRYYRLDTFKGDITDDLTTPTVDSGTGAKLYNVKVIDYQTAPMPFVTQQSGSLPTAVNITSNGVNGQDAVTYDWSIVKVEHDDVTFNDHQGHLGLFINATDAGSNPIEYHVTNDSELNVSWYLKLDGFIDLEGESQLVQGDDSLLDVTSAGKIEKDQQGTADVHTYNYWSSPVGPQSTSSNNNSYSLDQLLKDGSDAANPGTINFITNSYDGTNTNPIGIADYWIWKFANQTHDDYSSWQHVRSTGTLNAGEGYTMKGPGTGAIADDQNYVFTGKPNNGDINLSITAGNDYLIGNPYPSAIDAHEFITDNAPIIEGTGGITGTLYFWEHWGGGSHNLAEYQGGYAIYNLSGSTPSASKGTSDPDVSTGGTPTKTPGRYIPVGQGFFVLGEATGTIKFENDQRIFMRENANSVFMNPEEMGNGRTSSNNEGADLRPQLRLGFNSVNEIHRQLLVTVDENATSGIDWGYDGDYYDTQVDDMYWMLEGKKFTIQGTNELDLSTILPLGIHVDDEGLNSITIDAISNFDETMPIYLHDKELNVYHNLKESDYQFYAEAGEYLDRFEIAFNTGDTLSSDDHTIENLEVYYSNTNESIVLVNPTLKDVKSVELYNILGQSVFNTNLNTQTDYKEYKVSNLSTGTYVIKLKTVQGEMSKKVLVHN